MHARMHARFHMCARTYARAHTCMHASTYTCIHPTYMCIHVHDECTVHKAAAKHASDHNDDTHP
jgi:hypothetical protein